MKAIYTYPKTYRYELLSVVGYAAVVFILFSPIFFGTNLIFGDDIHRQYYFYRQFFISFLKEGIWPWWNPYVFSGAPFIANPVVNIWYPATWLFGIFPLPFAYALHISLHLWWAMTGLFFLCRFLLGKSNLLASWIGGIIFGLSGFFVARVYAGHVDVIAAASWMPWVVLTNAKWQMTNAKYRWGVLAACAFALQLYAGYQTMAFFTTLAVALVSVYYCVVQKSVIPLVKLVVMVILAFCYAALQLLPVQEFFRRSIRTFSMPYEWHAYGGLAKESLRQLIDPFPFGTHVTYTGPPPNFAEHAFFVGRVGIVLVIVAVIRLLKRRTELKLYNIVFVVLCFFALWMSLGAQAPYDLQKLAWHYIPMYSYLRIPSRHLVLFVFGASVLAAIGFSSLKRFQLLKVLSMLAVVIEMGWYARHFITTEPIPEYRHDQSLISFLQKSDSRVLPNFGVWIPPRDSFDFDAAMAYRIFSVSGYDPSILKNYYEFINAINGAPLNQVINDVQPPYLNIYSPYANMLNIGYLLLPTNYDPLFGVQLPQFSLAKEDVLQQYRLYQNTATLPRFFTVSMLKEIPTRELAAKEIAKQEILPDSVFVVSGTYPTVPFVLDCTNQAGTVKITSYTPNRITLTVDQPCNGILSSSEVMYPGWKAKVNGSESPVFESNLAFRTVYVPKGTSTVELYYSPTIFVLGSMVSGSVILGTLIWGMIVWKKRLQ